MEEEIEYTIVLSDLSGIFCPYLVPLASGRTITAVPIALDLPTCGKRFFKMMLLGEMTPETAADGVARFFDAHEDVFVIIERDAETIYVDELNSGITGTRGRLEKFLDLLLKRMESCGVTLTHIDDDLIARPPAVRIDTADHLGNTRVETFTEGPSKDVWEATKRVRARLLGFEGRPLDIDSAALLEEAWEHMLLAHNSDGRIGYWHSAWRPGEHVVVQSRRDFVWDHLRRLTVFWISY